MPGKIILIAIKNNIIPPAIPNEDSAICSDCKIYLPMNMKNNRTNRAIKSSLIIIFLRLLIGIFLRILKNSGTFPIGSMIKNNKKIADKTVT
jgi:hypothetical protein